MRICGRVSQACPECTKGGVTPPSYKYNEGGFGVKTNALIHPTHNLSGIIIEAKNTKEGTLLKILQSPAGFRGEPKDTDKSEGRFLVQSDSYLDLNIYTKGRSVTVAGQIQGKKVLPLGETEYTYPLIRAKEIYLWPILRRHHPYSYYSFERYYWWRESLLHRCIIPKKSHATPKK